MQKLREKMRKRETKNKTQFGQKSVRQFQDKLRYDQLLAKGIFGMVYIYMHKNMRKNDAIYTH